MDGGHVREPHKLKIYTSERLERIPQVAHLDRDRVDAMKAVSAVLPFRVNEYVCDELIDWNAIPNDPIFQLTFPQPGMLAEPDLATMLDLVRRGVGKPELRAAARAIQLRLNPHPAGQTSLNVPMVDGVPLPGMQHKYRETVLFFPTPGQTCHAYCSYCFRWAQFAGLEGLRFASNEPELLARYVARHDEVRSVLFTGGDPMVMKAKVLARYIEPLLSIEHLTSIRVGTKSVAYWPHRYVTDDDADDLLRLFERVAGSGKTLALMAHYSHPRELEGAIARTAVERIRASGAVVRCQAPLIRHVNDDADVWAELWNTEVKLGTVPYYMFVERDTGARGYFAVPLSRAFSIFSEARRRVSGLGRTVRGPSMSTTAGKVLVDGIAEVNGERVFVLKLIQARELEWVDRVFFAAYDETATWLDQLRPAFGKTEFFFEERLRELMGGGRHLSVMAPLDEAMSA